tara:strand:- start:38 stop:295 length:258 start_codon:yes stop_codon:yes gene_type:complete
MDVDKLNINSLKSEFSKYRKDLLHLNEYMYKNPELGYQEVNSVDKITKLIKKHVLDTKYKNLAIYQLLLLPQSTKELVKKILLFV